MQCRISQVLFIKIPLGCRRVGKGKLVPVTTPFDYVLIKDGVSVFLDAKTFDQSRISHSMLTNHQVNALHQVYEKNAIAGYLAWHRDINKVVFYSAIKLFELRPQTSLSTEEGLSLGPCEKIDFTPLFKALNIP